MDAASQAERGQPTLRELRARIRKPSEPLMSRLIYRPISLLVTWLLLPTPVTPHLVSWASALAMGGGLALIALRPESIRWALGGVLLLQLAFLLDHVDGDLARARGRTSRGGMFADEWAMEILFPIACAVALPMAVLATTHTPFWSYVGIAYAVARPANLATYMLSVHYGLTAATAEPGAAEGPPVGILQRAASWSYVAAKVVGAVSVAVLADALTSRYGLGPYFVAGQPLSLLSLYVGAATIVLGVSTLLTAIAGTRGRFLEKGRVS